MSSGECLLLETGPPGTGPIQGRTHLPDAIEDARGHSAHQRGIYLKNILVPDGLQMRESIPVRGLGIPVRAGGAYQYDIRIPRQNRLAVYDGRQWRHLRENIVPTAQRYHLADDMFARQRVQRPVPHLIKDLQPSLPFIACPQQGELGSIPTRRVGGGRGRSGETAKFDESQSDVVELALFRDEYLQMKALEFGANPWRGAGFPKDDERRRLAQQTFHIERRRFAQPGDLLGGGRIVAGVVDADDSCAGTRGKQQFGDVRTQTDDPRRALRRCRCLRRAYRCAGGEPYRRTRSHPTEYISAA